MNPQPTATSGPAVAPSPAMYYHAAHPTGAAAMPPYNNAAAYPVYYYGNPSSCRGPAGGYYGSSSPHGYWPAVPAQTSSSKMAVQHEPIEPTEHDILMGRGGNNNTHVGNEALREMARQLRTTYQQAAKKEKSNMSRQLVSKVHALGGRFLKRNDITSEWEVVELEYAREKCSQVLRDAVQNKHMPPPDKDAATKDGSSEVSKKQKKSKKSSQKKKSSSTQTPSTKYAPRKEEPAVVTASRPTTPVRHNAKSAGNKQPPETPLRSNTSSSKRKQAPPVTIETSPVPRRAVSRQGGMTQAEHAAACHEPGPKRPRVAVEVPAYDSRSSFTSISSQSMDGILHMIPDDDQCEDSTDSEPISIQDTASIQLPVESATTGNDQLAPLPLTPNNNNVAMDDPALSDSFNFDLFNGGLLSEEELDAVIAETIFTEPDNDNDNNNGTSYPMEEAEAEAEGFDYEFC